MKGWSRPNRASHDRFGGSKRSHYFVDGKSLCKKWVHNPRTNPDLEDTDDLPTGFCATCLRALIKTFKFTNGWAIPSSDNRLHVFVGGQSLCTGYSQSSDGQSIANKGSTEVCNHCEEIFKKYPTGMWPELDELRGASTK